MPGGSSECESEALKESDFSHPKKNLLESNSMAPVERGVFASAQQSQHFQRGFANHTRRMAFGKSLYLICDSRAVTPTVGDDRILQAVKSAKWDSDPV